MDFKKAFDTVPNKRLISKLKSINISKEIINLIEVLVLYINDLPDLTQPNTFLFADDINIFRPMMNRDD